MNASARFEETSCEENDRATDLARAVRLLAIDGVEAAKSGHPGLPLGMADVATVLWTEFLNVDPAAPDWADRDRFVLSAGHGSMLLYALLYLSGFPLKKEDLAQFRQLNSRTPGHPEYGHTPGVETTTGPLAQGLGNAVGMTLAEALLRADFGTGLVDHFTYALCGDGCLMEGLASEAITLAGHLKLARLIVLFDDNGITIDGSTDLATSEDHQKRFEAAGWQVACVDGHDPAQIRAALTAAKADEARPSLIMCKTTIGQGAPNKAGSAGVHGAPLGAEEAALARKQLGFEGATPFEVPADLLHTWRLKMARGEQVRKAWEARADESPTEAKRLTQRLNRLLPDNWEADFKKAFAAQDWSKPTATRAQSGKVLELLAPLIPGLLGGSADLSGSNNTQVSAMQVVTPGASEKIAASGYVHYGIREHGMAAMMSGVALHGGFVPYGGTFLVFSDYMRPSMRLAALMKVPVIYVLTHDSIGLGEDGPTHQPVEHAWSLRLIPGLHVFRPADAVEVAECWTWMLQQKSTPCALLLSRQKVPALRKAMDLQNTTARGAYILREAEGVHRVTMWATGSEVGLACDVRDALQNQGVGVRVISAPCLELFEAQDAAYKARLCGGDVLQASIEAGVTKPWGRYVGARGFSFGVDTFGASAPAPHVYEAFGLTTQAITQKLRARLQQEKPS